MVNGVCRNLDRVEPPAQVEQQLRIEAGADLSREHQVRPVVVADQQRAEADARALRIGESADDELLRRLAFHLQPVLRAAVFVGRAAPFGDHAFPSLAPRALPRLRVVQELDAPHRRRERQFLQQGAPILERQRRHVVAVQPQDVEDVIPAVTVPGDLAVEDDLVDRQAGDRGRQRREVLGRRLREYSWTSLPRL